MDRRNLHRNSNFLIRNEPPFVEFAARQDPVKLLEVFDILGTRTSKDLSPGNEA